MPHLPDGYSIVPDGIGNPSESVFATLRHPTFRTKGALSRKTAEPMVFELITAAAKTWGGVAWWVGNCLAA